jgi:hypothetical protein
MASPGGTAAASTNQAVHLAGSRPRDDANTAESGPTQDQDAALYLTNWTAVTKSENRSAPRLRRPGYKGWDGRLPKTARPSGSRSGPV